MRENSVRDESNNKMKVQERGLLIMKKRLSIILACAVCAVCLLPASLAQAKEVTVSPNRLVCGEGMHGTVHLKEIRTEYGDWDNTNHWTKVQQVATCDLCGEVLQVVKESKEDVERHTMTALGECGVCHFLP